MAGYRIGILAALFLGLVTFDQHRIELYAAAAPRTDAGPE